MKRFYRFTAAVLALALAGSCALPAFAAGEVTKDENVFLILNADGSVKSQTVSDWLHSDGDLSGFADTTVLQNITALKGDWQLEQKGDQLTLSGSGNDLYYQGSTEKTPPVSAEIRYTLDGAPVTAGELQGKAGHVTIRIALTNNQKFQKQIGGKLREVYTPFVTMVAVNLPGDAFTNLRAEHGTVQTDSENQLAAFVTLPGMKATFDGMLPRQLDGLYDYFLDEVTIEADTQCFEMPAIMLAAATSMEELKKDGVIDTDEFEDLDDKLDQLKTATQDLQDGITALKNATGDLVEGVTTLDGAVGALNGGAGDLKDGAQKLAEGAASVADGAAALNGLLGRVCESNDTLNQGAASIFDALLASATAQLRSQAPALGMAPEDIPDLTADNYQTVLGGILSGLGEENIYGQVKAAVEAQVKTDENRAKARAQITAVTAATVYAKQQNPDADQAAIDAAVQAILADTAQLQLILSNSDMQAMLATEEMQAMLASTAEAQLDALVVQALSEGGSAYAQLQGALAQAGAASQTLNGALMQLGQVQGFVQGVAAYTGSVRQIYQQGAGPLNEGAKQVQSGANTLKDGAAKLKEGTGSLKDGTRTLLDGAIKLSGGAAELSSGMTEYKTEGVDQLTGKLEELNLVDFRQLTDELEAQANAYTSYTGAAEGVKASVKFVMKVEAPKAPAEAELKHQTEQPEAQPAEKVGLWQRIKDLFK